MSKSGPRLRKNLLFKRALQHFKGLNLLSPQHTTCTPSQGPSHSGGRVILVRDVNGSKIYQSFFTSTIPHTDTHANIQFSFPCFSGKKFNHKSFSQIHSAMQHDRQTPTIFLKLSRTTDSFVFNSASKPQEIKKNDKKQSSQVRTRMTQQVIILSGHFFAKKHLCDKPCCAKTREYIFQFQTMHGPV